MKVKLNGNTMVRLIVGILAMTLAGSRIGNTIGRPLLMAVFSIGIVLVSTAENYQLRRKIQVLEEQVNKSAKRSA